jgi:hypothetical protein
MKMNKVFLSLLLSCASFCSNAQNKNIDICPPATYVAFTFEFDAISFHRPRFDCCRGFFICIQGHWSFYCAPNTQQLIARITEDGIVQGYYLLLNKKVEIHLPAMLAELPQYANEDMTTFSVEKDWIDIFFGDRRLGALKEGDYVVARTDAELIISVDIE